MYTKNIVEFVTVGVEYCAFLEHSDEKTPAVFADVMRKLLPLLYMKTVMLDKPQPLGQEDTETFVTEGDYELIRTNIARLMGQYDAYFDGEQASSVSENLADIYQDLKDFVMNYKKGIQEVSNDALFTCLENFSLYWGARLINALRQLHQTAEAIQNPEQDAWIPLSCQNWARSA